MNYNILVGGAAGQGMKSLSNIISLSLKRHGYHVFMNTVYMSRIRGGHNFFQIRFSDEPVLSHSDTFDMILALNQETIDLHQDCLNDYILCDHTLSHDKKIGVPAKQTAKELNHLQGENIVLLGAFVKAFKLDLDIFKLVIRETFKSKAAELNSQALILGYNSIETYYTTKDKTKDNAIIINGNTSIALGAITAGLSVYSAYPMTPATSIMNYLLKKEKEAGFIVEQAEDEIAAIHIALGASAAGVRSMTSSSGGGLSLMVEALGLTAITETPLVVVDVMRPGPATGLATKTGQSDLSFLLTASQDELPRMIIAVRDQEDAFYQTIRAFDLADKYQIPVIILNDQYLADASKTIAKFDFDIEIDRHLASEDIIDTPYKRYKFSDTGISPRIIPGQYNRPVIADNHEHNEFGEITEDPKNRVKMHLKRLKKLDTLKNDLIEPKYVGPETTNIILVGFGSTQGAIEEAVLNLNQKGHKVSGMIFGDVYPLPTKLLEQYKDKVLINVEMNATGQFSRLIRMETGITFEDSILKFDGLQINAKDIEEVLYERHF